MQSILQRLLVNGYNRQDNNMLKTDFKLTT